MQLDLRGKRALVCGASKGLGRASAIELSKLGANITLLARSADQLSALAHELDQQRVHEEQDHDFLVADLDDTDELRKRIKTLVAATPIHILIHNTGGPPAGRILDAEPDAFLHALNRHLIAGQVLVQTVVPGMRQAGYGRIVNIVSTSIYQPIPNLGVSNTTRGAIGTWAKTLSHELAPDGITVNNVLPGSTDTERLRELLQANAERSGQSMEEVVATWEAEIPLGRFGRPEEIGQAVAFLASPAAAYITGVSLPVDGGKVKSV